jgi:hypothetical protein
MALKAGDNGPVTEVTMPIFTVSAAPLTTGSNTKIGSKKSTFNNKILFMADLHIFLVVVL